MSGRSKNENSNFVPKISNRSSILTDQENQIPKDERESVPDFDLKRKLGEGAYGSVYLGANKTTREIFAVKRCLINIDNPSVPIGVLREANIFSKISAYPHENLTKVLNISVTHGKSPCAYVINIVMEYCDTDLANYLSRLKEPMPWYQIFSLSRQLISGLCHLHDLSILHRDMKPANILLQANGCLKITDFGLCRALGTENSLTNVVITLWYRPPELLLDGGAPYNSAVDIWSLGVILLEMCNNLPPFQSRTELAMIQEQFTVLGFPTESNWPPNSGVSRQTFLSWSERNISPNHFPTQPISNSKIRDPRMWLKFFSRRNPSRDLPFYFIDLIMSCLNFNMDLRPTCRQLLIHLNKLSGSAFICNLCDKKCLADFPHLENTTFEVGNPPRLDTDPKVLHDINNNASTCIGPGYGGFYSNNDIGIKCHSSLPQNRNLLSDDTYHIMARYYSSKKYSPSFNIPNNQGVVGGDNVSIFCALACHFFQHRYKNGVCLALNRDSYFQNSNLTHWIMEQCVLFERQLEMEQQHQELIQRQAERQQNFFWQDNLQPGVIDCRIGDSSVKSSLILNPQSRVLRRHSLMPLSPSRTDHLIEFNGSNNESPSTILGPTMAGMTVNHPSNYRINSAEINHKISPSFYDQNKYRREKNLNIDSSINSSCSPTVTTTTGHSDSPQNVSYPKNCSKKDDCVNKENNVFNSAGIRRSYTIRQNRRVQRQNPLNFTSHYNLKNRINHDSSDSSSHGKILCPSVLSEYCDEENIIQPRNYKDSSSLYHTQSTDEEENQSQNKFCRKIGKKNTS